MNNDDYFEELARHYAGQLVEERNFENRGTALKSAEQLKKETRQQLTEFLQFKQIRSQIVTAEYLIRENLKNLISHNEYKDVIEQLNQAPKHFRENINNRKENFSEKLVFPQDVFGFSNDCLMHFYTVANALVNKKDYENAIAVLVWLELLAPYVSSYWTAHGLCLQLLNNHNEAIEMFIIAKEFSPKDPSIVYYLYNSYSKSKMKEDAKNELQLLNSLISNLPAKERADWNDRIKGL